MIQVKSFLGCFSLKSFALVIGWLNLIPMILLALLSTSALANEVINQSGFAVLVPLVSLLVYSLLAYISIQLIVGVRHRYPNKVRSFKYLIIFYLIVCLLIVVEGIYDAISFPDDFKDNILYTRIMAGLVVLFLVLYYFLICIDSLSLALESEEILPTTNPLLESLMKTGNFNYNTN